MSHGVLLSDPPTLVETAGLAQFHFECRFVRTDFRGNKGHKKYDPLQKMIYRHKHILQTGKKHLLKHLVCVLHIDDANCGPL